MFSLRLKELRKERNMTQVQLAEALGVSKGTVAMWEIGKREPNFETLNALSGVFDRRIDYILGYSQDASSAKKSEAAIDELGRWAAEESFYETIMTFLRLDAYGKDTVENVIRSESVRCREQGSLFPEENFMLSVRIKKEDGDDMAPET